MTFLDWQLTSSLIICLKPLKSMTISEVGGETKGQIGHIFRFPDQDFHPVVDLEDLTGLSDGLGSVYSCSSTRYSVICNQSAGGL